jgi:hypothetical protein
MEQIKHLTDDEWKEILGQKYDLRSDESVAFIQAMRLADKGKATRANLELLRQNPVFVTAETKVFSFK